MPVYEYRRPDGTTFEVLQSFSEAALTHDPDTGVPVERVLHAPAIHFKGKGFYATDVGREKQRRLLERAAERGANEHDEKFHYERKQKAKAAEQAKNAKPKQHGKTPPPRGGGRA